MAGLMREAGFVDVVEKRFKWPIGPWSSDPKLKEIGRWNLLNWEEGMEGWVMAAYTRVLGVGPRLSTEAMQKLTCCCSGPTSKSRIGCTKSGQHCEIANTTSSTKCKL